MHLKKIYDKIFIVNIFILYLFFMKKIKLITLVYIIFSFMNSYTSYAAAWANELDKSKENVSIIASFFTTDMLLNIFFAIIVVFLTFVSSKVLSSKLARYLEDSWNWENREELVGVLSRTTHITVLFIWFAITLTILWVDMWIFLGWLWFWLWFTLKIFLSNFVAWIIMVTQWTYHNWDLIQLEDWKMWNIKRIHSLFTAVQQFDGVIYYVPNVKFLEENVSNYNSNDKRRVEVEVWVDYNTDIVKAKRVMMQVIKQFPHVLISPEPFVTVDKLDESSVNMILRFWIAADGWDYLKTKSNVTETIHLAFRQSWITIPFPQVTISNREVSNNLKEA